VIWQHPESSPDWSHGIAAGAEEEPERARPDLLLAPSKRPRSFPGRSPSAEEGGGRTRVEELLRSRTAATRGTLVHAWLEKLVWIEDFEIDEQRMLESAASIEPELGPRREALALLEAALRNEAVREALSREAFDAPAGASLEVFAEYAFRVLLDDEQDGTAFWSGSIDRLVLVRDGDRVVAAEILDYKTDSVQGELLRQRAEHYRPQLEAYRRVVVAQTGLEPSAVRTRLLFLEAGVVV
jgi:ATP-dependent exoDNAse (exonuclease V) beta subunit